MLDPNNTHPDGIFLDDNTFGQVVKEERCCMFDLQYGRSFSFEKEVPSVFLDDIFCGSSMQREMEIQNLDCLDPMKVWICFIDLTWG